MSKRLHRPRVSAILATLILILLAVASVRWQATLNALGSFLVESQPPEKADMVLILGGEFYGPRVLKGAELVRQHYAPFALISGPLYMGRPEGYWAIDFLAARGYPRKFFQVFATTARSTIDEAKALSFELARRRVKRVLLVTSDYHSRRAAMVVRWFSPEVRFISAPAPDSHYRAAQWWQDDSSWRFFWSEWGKILGSVVIVYPQYVLRRIEGIFAFLPGARLDSGNQVMGGESAGKFTKR